ncbi:hypothetical protein [Streptomyces sp. NPDC048643]|uniref:hypothetical protein n=1 Tax=Streptomyces sp. NPDC048643 TaxID=3155637 RepID=UPI00341DBEF4
MKPEQDPERNQSGDAAMKGRVTPVPPERPADDRAKAADSASDEDVSRREALKGHLDPAADEQTPGDRAKSGGAAAVRSATTSDEAKARTTTGTTTGTGATTGTGISDEAKARAARTGDDTAARTTGTGTPARESADVRTGERAASHDDRTSRTGTGPSVTSRDTDLDTDNVKPGSVQRNSDTGRGDTAGALPTSGSADTGTRTDGKVGQDSAKDSAKHGERLLPGDEYDKFSQRMRHAVGGFVDGPEASVEEADHVLEELASRFTEAVSQRRRSLRTAWQSGGEGKASASDTEKLRLALQDYREMAERLLHI